MNASRSDALVLFGASGDLVYHKIFPALLALARRGQLDLPVIGVARTDWTLEQFRARARESIERHGELEAEVLSKLCSRLRYVKGDYADTATFTALRGELGRATRPLHYLAIPPSMFPTVVEALGRSGDTRDARAIVEKPFGRDLALSANGNVALMCAEAMTWRCHRSLVADALSARGAHVEHITGAKRSTPHRLTELAHAEGRA